MRRNDYVLCPRRGVPIDTPKELRRKLIARQDIAKPKPIGYWLKHADNVITEHVDKVLNIIYQAGTITRSGVLDTMQTFIDARQLDKIIEEFVEQGWLVKHGEKE